MAEVIEIHQPTDGGAGLAPFAAPGAEKVMAAKVDELYAELELCNEENHMLKKTIRRLERMLYEAELKLTKMEAQNRAAAPLADTDKSHMGREVNYYFQIGQVDQLNAQVAGGAEVTHTKL